MKGKRKIALPERKLIRIALAGNANVGKSVIFNELTGLHQHIGNWPGKTVERGEGTLSFQGYTIDIIDLPGIYSLSTYSIEEQISRSYIALQKPDVIVNVVDASALERNLFFTLQLLELEPRMVVALNQIDVAEAKGIRISAENLSKMLCIPVIPTVGIKNVGLQELMSKVVEIAIDEKEPCEPIQFGSEIEKRIEVLIRAVEEIESPYPSRWIAVKLLEDDEEVKQLVNEHKPILQAKVEELKGEIEEIHGHDAASVIASERYAIAHRMANEAYERVEKRMKPVDYLDQATSHPVLGYLFMAVIVLAMFYGIFVFGDLISGLLNVGFASLKSAYDSFFSGQMALFVWSGLVEGVIAGTTIAIPYIIPFYLALSVLEDSGYLARVAFLTDSAMHKIGLHGKAFIPLMLGFGCNVPACLGCRIMETERERLICAFTASLIPCTARSIVIMGLVAQYVGIQWAVVMYLIDFGIILALGRLAFKAVPGEPVGLIMEMPPYRRPMMRITASRTWFRLRDFIRMAFPIMIIGNLVIQIANILGILNYVQVALSPITVLWLGLPAMTGVTLIFGILRKELTLILLASLAGTSNFAAILTPEQMFVFAFVIMIYIPCIATIAVLAKEFGYRVAAIISMAEIGFAIVLGGILLRLLNLFSLP